MNNYLISYDIADDGLRNRLAKALLKAGCRRLQKSVYVAPQFSAREYQALRSTVAHTLQHHTRTPTDSVLCVPVDKAAFAQLRWEGDATFFEWLLKDELGLMI